MTNVDLVNHSLMLILAEKFMMTEKYIELQKARFDEKIYTILNRVQVFTDSGRRTVALRALFESHIAYLKSVEAPIMREYEWNDDNIYWVIETYRLLDDLMGDIATMETLSKDAVGEQLCDWTEKLLKSKQKRD